MATAKRYETNDGGEGNYEAESADHEQALTERIRETGELALEDQPTTVMGRWALAASTLEEAHLLSLIVPGVTYEMAEANLRAQYAEIERRRFEDNMGGALNDADRGW